MTDCEHEHAARVAAQALAALGDRPDMLAEAIATMIYAHLQARSSEGRRMTVLWADLHEGVLARLEAHISAAAAIAAAVESSRR